MSKDIGVRPHRGLWIFQGEVDLSDVQQTVPAGIYELDAAPGLGEFFAPREVTADHLVMLHKGVMGKLFEEIDIFFADKTREIYKHFGLTHRMGVLLYGPPGTGKTCINMQVAAKLIEEQNCLVFWNPRNFRSFTNGIRRLRRLDPGRQVLIVLEDFEDYADDRKVLSFLDGEDKIDNCMILATTNYASHLPARLTNRPSRFARRIKVGAPDQEGRREFLVKHIPEPYCSQIDLDQWAELSEGLTIDHLKHLAQYVFVFRRNIEEACAELRAPLENDE